jgi:hypothetical protein
MQISDNWKQFLSNFNKMVDRRTGQTELVFSDLEPEIKKARKKSLSLFDKNLKGLLSVSPEKKPD